MVDVQETGNQYEEYKSSRDRIWTQTEDNWHLLLACDDRGVEQCGSPRPAHIYVGSIQEVQNLCGVIGKDYDLTLFGQTVSVTKLMVEMS